MMETQVTQEALAGLSENVETVVMTLGNRGSLICNQGQIFYIDPIEVEVVDTTGAGDSFTAGLIYKLLTIELDQISEEIAEEIIQFAIACGAHVCSGVGAIEAQPYREDIDKLLSLSNGGMS